MDIDVFDWWLWLVGMVENVLECDLGGVMIVVDGCL